MVNENKNIGDTNSDRKTGQSQSRNGITQGAKWNGTIGSIRAALWDAHYGKGLSAEYARSADAALDALVAETTAREHLLNVSLDLLIDVLDSRAGQRFSAIGLSRIKAHIADLRATLAPADESAQRPISDLVNDGPASKSESV